MFDQYIFIVEDDSFPVTTVAVAISVAVAIIIIIMVSVIAAICVYYQRRHQASKGISIITTRVHKREEKRLTA